MVDAAGGLAERRVVGVTGSARGVERGAIPFIEGGAFAETTRQIGIGDEQFAEGDGIGIAGRQRRIAAGEVEAFVGHIHATEQFFELWPYAVGAQALTCGNERQLALAKLTRHITEGGERIRIAHIVRITAR